MLNHEDNISKYIMTEFSVPKCLKMKKHTEYNDVSLHESKRRHKSQICNICNKLQRCDVLSYLSCKIDNSTPEQ